MATLPVRRHHVLRLALTLILLCVGCSKRPFTSNDAALRSVLQKVRGVPALAARAPTAAVKPEVPMVLMGESQASGNTLVVRDVEVSDLGKKIDCFNLAPNQPSCGDYGFWVGSNCLREAAHIVEQGSYMSNELSSGWAENCASYLLRVRYVVFVSTKVLTSKGSTSSAFKGTATVVDLSQGVALGAFDLDVSEAGQLGGEFIDKNGGHGRYVVKDGADPLWMAGFQLAAELKKRFPGTQTPEYDSRQKS